MKILSLKIDKELLDFLKAADIVVTTENGSLDRALMWLEDSTHDMIIMDIDAVGWVPYPVTRLRKLGITVPIIGIAEGGSSETEWSDQIATFLENKGDSLLRGPVNPRELLAVLRTIERWRKTGGLDIVSFTHDDCLVEIDAASGLTWVNKDPVELSAGEMKVLSILAQAKGRPLRATYIADARCSTRALTCEENVIETLVHRIRAKLERCHSHASHVLQTKMGAGYFLASKPE